MTTATATVPKIKPCLARLGLVLDGTNYAVRLMPQGTDPDAVRVVRLGKDDGTRYHVRQMRAGGIICSCPSGTYRPTEVCRHARGLVSVGILENVATVPAAPLELEHKPRKATTATPEPIPTRIPDELSNYHDFENHYLR